MAKRTALYDEHVKLNAKIVDFHGWDLPVIYTNLIEEHQSVRQYVGMFDVSHMGILEVQGIDAKNLLQTCTVNDIEKLVPGKTQYSMICDVKGGILDDLMVSCLAEDHYKLVVNAGNSEKIQRWLETHASSFDTTQIIHRNELNILAIQGPKAIELISEACDIDIALNPMTFIETKVLGKSVSISTTGYTGEKGAELFASDEDISFIWRYFLNKGVRPCGLGARDTLRIEAGLPLYGQELSIKINPLMTNYAWVVKLNKGEFIGREALINYQVATKKTYTYGVIMNDKAIPRAGYLVQDVGTVSSGTFSPTLGKSIAMILSFKQFSNGDSVYINIRGKSHMGIICSLPFYKKNSKFH